MDMNVCTIVFVKLFYKTKTENEKLNNKKYGINNMCYPTFRLKCFNEYFYMNRGIWGCTACKDYVQQKGQRASSIRRPDAGTNWYVLSKPPSA